MDTGLSAGREVVRDGAEDEVERAAAAAADAALAAGRSRDAVPRRWAPALVLGGDALGASALLGASGVAGRSPGGVLTAVLALLLGAAVSRRISDTRLVAARGALEEAPRILLLALVASFAGAVAADVLSEPVWGADELVLTCALLATAAFAAQVVAVRVLRGVLGPERCLVVGSAEDRARLRRQLSAASVTHLVAVAGIDVPLLGRGDGDRPTLEDLIARHRIDRVIVLPDRHRDREAQAARRARNAGARVTVVARSLAAIGERVRMERAGAAILVSADPAAPSVTTRALKRALDVAGAVTGLLVLAPVLAGIALAVRLGSPGPVLFWQERVGLAGRRFRIAKFRTMVVDAEDRKEALRVHNEAGGGLFKIAEDPRVTPLGRVLRRTSLDELPQLINVLRGDMSLVGPRPLVGDEDELVEGWYRDRLRLKPGMTGAWQVMGSARIPLDEMVALDHQYVAGWSLWLDVRILLRTVVFVLTRRGL